MWGTFAARSSATHWPVPSSFSVIERSPTITSGTGELSLESSSTATSTLVIRQVVTADPVPELTKLYRRVNGLIEYRKAIARVPEIEQTLAATKQDAEQLAGQSLDLGDAKAAKKHKKSVAATDRRIASLETQRKTIQDKIAAVDNDPQQRADAEKHANVDKAVLEETAKLHQGDKENLALWEQFLPFCKDEINRVYDRLDVEFDHTLDESFYHSMLGQVVDQLEAKGLASPSDGAMCVFLDGFDAPMIVRKKDGAFLYATTDLATLRYRLDEFKPTEILYVVDTRQSEHFDKIFAVADEFGLQDVKLVHVNFGTVLGEDGKPMKTRSGSLIGLESLLDDAVDRARAVVCDAERLQNFDPPMDAAEQEVVAETVGIGAIKFADLGHHRTSDYKFNLNKMVALEGNTSTYVQYSFARTQKILERAEKAESDVIAMVNEHGFAFVHPAERALALSLLRFEEALLAVHKDYAPNALVDYLLETARTYSRFNDSCHVLKAETEAIQATRLALVALTGRVLQLGLEVARGRGRAPDVTHSNGRNEPPLRVDWKIKRPDLPLLSFDCRQPSSSFLLFHAGPDPPRLCSTDLRSGACRAQEGGPCPQ